jgi:hypothetical protein
MHFKPDLALLLLFLLLKQNKIKVIHLYLSKETSHISIEHLCWWWPVLAMGWIVRGLNPSGGNIFCAPPGQHQGPPNLLFKGIGSYSGIKRPGHGADGWGVVPNTRPLLLPRLQMSWSYTSASPVYLYRHVMGWPLPLLLPVQYITAK